LLVAHLLLVGGLLLRAPQCGRCDHGYRRSSTGNHQGAKQYGVD
jgi:hypothetical protein